RAVMGTLTRKIHCQPPTDRTKPPMVGPRAALTEAATDIMASACAGIRPPPAAARIKPSPDGYAVEVAKACTTRAATSQPKVGENGAAIETRRATVRPVRNTRRAPRRSA